MYEYERDRDLERSRQCEYAAVSNLNDVAILVDKMGGGTVGREYNGTWHVSVVVSGDVVWENDTLITGMPKTHAQVVEAAHDFYTDSQEN